ncbi:MAG TPA: DUF3352 domain-containing protein [Pyrinomonadaceae bacterium]|nr:DUF3352 domain-containing protein [Pyrinomonadaceae bacterium]
MEISKLVSRILTVLLILVFLALPIAAQQKRQTPKRPPPAPVAEPVVTFDTLLTEDSYRIYSEVRNVGQLVRSTGVNELLEPIIKLSEPPKEFQTLLKWINSHADALATSRMLVASWPTKPNLPMVLIAVDFSTVDEARKFESALRRFMPKLMPKPSPSPVASPGSDVATMPAMPAQTESVSNEPPYVIKQNGSLVLLTDKPLALRDLKPRGSKLLVEDPNFATARNRFSSESVFVYFDVKSINKQEEEQRKKWEAEDQKRREAEAANPPAPEMIQTPPSQPEPAGEPSPANRPDEPVTVELVGPGTVPNPDGSTGGQLTAQVAGPMDTSFFSLSSLIFGGQAKWPEAIAVAANFEDEGYVVRALMVNEAESRANAIPFIPQFVSGPAIVPAAANIMPADSELFVSVSLDYAQVYDGMVKAMAGNIEIARRVQPQIVASTQPSSPFAEYEKKLGLKVKDDILPLLGNEIALAIPKKKPQPAATPTPAPALEPSSEDGPTMIRAPDQTPIIAISIKDKDAVRKLLPKIVDSMSVKGASLFAQTERRGETEITSYANIFAYAFIGDFLVLTPDAALTRHVVDSYLKNETLSADSHYKNSTRWQPRQVQGQVYAGRGVIDLYNPFGSSAPVDERLLALMARLNPVIDPMTYSLTNEGVGSLHELHLPKNLLMLMIAGMTSQVSETPIVTNESIAQSLLRTIAAAQSTFRETKGKGNYASLDELAKEGLISKDLFEKYGYRIEVTVLSNKFEATAVPLEYGKTGRKSYFVDETQVLRGGDHGGGPATIADKPVEY